MSTNYSIMQRFELARKRDRVEYIEKEVKKIGNLRAGSTGMMAETGDVAGNCHRKSHLRSLGLEIDEPTTDKLIMFELGYANEDLIVKVLEGSLAPGEVMLREEQIPIEWQTTNGTKVTGRPDIVICRLDGVVQVPLIGLELKSVHSVWTARDVLFGRHPKTANLVQAAHYMWKLDIPYKLVYRSYSQLGQGGSDWLARMLPKPGEPLSEHIEFNEKGKMKHVRQFEVVYDLRFDVHGRLQFKLEAETPSYWTNTIITRPDIERYFEYVSRMEADKQLGPRPMAIDPQGNKLNYTDCDYCPMSSVCDRSEKLGYDKWLDAVKQEIQSKVYQQLDGVS